jgi:hypothetical protein
MVFAPAAGDFVGFQTVVAASKDRHAAIGRIAPIAMRSHPTATSPHVPIIRRTCPRRAKQPPQTPFELAIRSRQLPASVQMTSQPVTLAGAAFF